MSHFFKNTNIECCKVSKALFYESYSRHYNGPIVFFMCFIVILFNITQCVNNLNIIPRVPGYDAIIDLKVWSNPAGFYLARSADGSGETSYYHINVCKSVGGSSPCPDNGVVCQVDDTQLKVKSLSPIIFRF